MIGEVHYWRDITRVLEAINLELKQPFVEIVIQVLSAAPDNQDNKALLADVKQFQKEKSRVLKGVKEAKWNHKYMKIIEKPVKDIQQAKDLKTVQITVGPLMKSLHNIYNCSNFYKEARIVSFVDRLLDCIQQKLKMKISMHKALDVGRKGEVDAFCD